MSAILPIPEREAQAKREIGHTEISRGGAWTLIVALLVMFLLGTVLQLVINPEPLRNLSSLPPSAANAWEAEGAGSRLFRANRALLGAMKAGRINWRMRPGSGRSCCVTANHCSGNWLRKRKSSAGSRRLAAVSTGY